MTAKISTFKIRESIKAKFFSMWIEINIKRSNDDVDYAGLGIKKPKNYKPDIYHVRRLIWHESIVWIEEVGPDEVIVQLEGTPEPINVKGNYDELAIQLNDLSDITEEDLEL